MASLGTMAALSIAIPAHNEEACIGRCIDSVLTSASVAGASVEVVVALNRCTDRTGPIAESRGARCVAEDSKCIASVRNTGVRSTSSNNVATLDADSWMHPRTIREVLRRLSNPGFVGGGSVIWPERLSLGILCSLAVVAPYVISRGVSAGMFWFRREAFDVLSGFDERMFTGEDLDFAVRLKRLGRQRGLRYGTIWSAGITTSCRKFDHFGDWHLFRNPALVRSLVGGRSRMDADAFYYDLER
jgi:glycosyltransferase involved in cell wall biosynthesis